jgi:hypothetical protein
MMICRIRKAVWRLWSPFLTRRRRGEEEPPMGILLAPGDEPNRACIQLYHTFQPSSPGGDSSAAKVSAALNES